MHLALSALRAGPPCRPLAVLLIPARGRKTRHDPPAKSKVGRVNTPPAVDPAEFFVLAERYRLYRQTVRALRISRLQQEARELEQQHAEEQARRALEEQAWVRLREQEVQQLQEEAKNFITRENLEARVEEALNSSKNYNWAITRQGLVVRPQ